MNYPAIALGLVVGCIASRLGWGLGEVVIAAILFSVILTLLHGRTK